MFKLNRSGVGEVKCILGNVPVKGLSQSSPYLLIGYFVREGVHLSRKAKQKLFQNSVHFAVKTYL